MKKATTIEEQITIIRDRGIILDYSEEKWNWIKKLTGIHKLTYKLDADIKSGNKDPYYAFELFLINFKSI